MPRTFPAGALWNVTRNCRLAARCYRITGWLERGLGLLVGPPLGADEALWIDPCGSIHTWGMGYTIDVVFLDDGRNVLHVARGVRPWRVVPAPRGTRSVIELRSGRGVRVTPGDCVEVRPS